MPSYIFRIIITPPVMTKSENFLIKSSGFLKKQIAGAQIMRTIPELSFYYDDTEDRAAKVDTLLASLRDDFDDEDEEDQDIDIDDILDDDDYFDFDEEDDEEDYDDYEDEEEDEEEE